MIDHLSDLKALLPATEGLMHESSIKEDWKPVLSDFEHSEAGKKIEQLLAKQAEGLKIFRRSRTGL